MGAGGSLNLGPVWSTSSRTAEATKRKPVSSPSTPPKKPKTKSTNSRYKRRMQVKDTENIFNKVIEEKGSRGRIPEPGKKLPSHILKTLNV